MTISRNIPAYYITMGEYLGYECAIIMARKNGEPYEVYSAYRIDRKHSFLDAMALDILQLRKDRFVHVFTHR